MGGSYNAKMLPFLKTEFFQKAGTLRDEEYKGASRMFTLRKGVRNVPKLIVPSFSTIFSGVATIFLITSPSRLNFDNA